MNGYHKLRLSVCKWSKHGQMALYIPGHDPPLDITIYLDIATNPGPCSSISKSSNLCNETEVNLHNRELTALRSYTRGQLFKIRHTSNITLSNSVLTDLKQAGIFHSRGYRAGYHRNQSSAVNRNINDINKRHGSTSSHTEVNGNPTPTLRLPQQLSQLQDQDDFSMLDHSNNNITTTDTSSTPNREQLINPPLNVH